MKRIFEQEVFLCYIFAFILLLIIISSGVFRWNSIIEDPFHYGEYFASSFGKAAYPENSLPLTIHGALDYLPSAFAIKFFGVNKFFLPTIGIYKLFNAVSAILFVYISVILVGGVRKNLLILTLAGFISVNLVGYRDLFLLASILALLLSFTKLVKHGLSSYTILLLMLLGFFVSFGLFWSYDRGIVGMVTIIPLLVWLSYKNKAYILPVLFSLFILVFAPLKFELFSYYNYFDNLKVLLETSSQWRYPLNKDTIELIFVAISFNLAMLVIFFNYVKSLEGKISWLLFGVVVLLNFLMLKIGINRADLQHIYYAFTMPLFLGLFLANRVFEINPYVNIINFFVAFCLAYMAIKFDSLVFTVSFLLLLHLSWGSFFIFRSSCNFAPYFLAIIIFVLIIKITANFYNDRYDWVSDLYDSVPNKYLATNGVVWVAQNLNESGVNCVFDLSNNGVINGLLRLPSCSRFTYPVYANNNYESELILSLMIAKPKAIVYSAQFWSYRIDDKSMESRFPELNKVIISLYPYKKCAYGYCIRFN